MCIQIVWSQQSLILAPYLLKLFQERDNQYCPMYLIVFKLQLLCLNWLVQNPLCLYITTKCTSCNKTVDATCRHAETFYGTTRAVYIYQLYRVLSNWLWRLWHIASDAEFDVLNSQNRFIHELTFTACISAVRGRLDNRDRMEIRSTVSQLDSYSPASAVFKKLSMEDVAQWSTNPNYAWYVSLCI